VRICSFKQNVKVCKKDATYRDAIRALCDGRDNNPTHKETFNKFIAELKKKNPKWDMITIGCAHSPARTLFQEENNEGYKMLTLIPKGHSS